MKLKSFGIVLAVCLALTAAVLPVHAQTTGGPAPKNLAADKEIVAEGIGSGATKQDALRDAMRKAIEKAVGVYVMAKTSMTDQELKEQIIVTSDAVVTNYKEIKCVEDDGIWLVRIEAKVLPNEYLKYASKLVTQDVSLEIGNLLNTVDAMSNTEAVLDEIFEDDLFLKLYKFRKTGIRMGDNVDISGDKAAFKLDFDLTFDQEEYKKFQTRLCAFLDKIARHKMTFTEKGGSDRATTEKRFKEAYTITNRDALWKESGIDDSERSNYCNISVETAKSKKTTYTLYLVRKEIYELILKKQLKYSVLVFSFSKADGGESDPFRIFLDFDLNFGKDSTTRGRGVTYSIITFTNWDVFSFPKMVDQGDKRTNFPKRREAWKQCNMESGYSTAKLLTCDGSGTGKGTLNVELPSDFAKRLKDVYIYSIANRDDLDDEECEEKAAEIESKYWKQK